jgi:hypothetical protein
MVFKLGLEAQKHWRRLNGPEMVAKPIKLAGRRHVSLAH